MRAISFLIATTILASCTYGPPPPAMAGPAPAASMSPRCLPEKYQAGR